MLVIGNGRLITRDENNTFYDNGAVAIDGGLIVRVGKCDEVKAAYPEAEFLDCEGGVIMPGLINAHEHIYSALARGLQINGYDPKGFLDILEGLWWTLDRHLTLDITAASALCTYIDCVENGVTTIIDHHASYGGVEGSLFEIADTAKQFGVRSNLCYEISDRDGEEKMKLAVKENVEFINWARQQPDDRFFGLMGMHAPFTLSDKTLEYCAAQMPSGAGVHIHVAEGIYDVLSSLKEHGKPPVMRLNDFGVLGENSILAHCTHVSQAEMELIKDTNTMVSHNPESNMGNAVGCPPTMKMVRMGILAGLGTDGYTNDMLESYKVGNLLHKHSLCDPNAAWAEIPQMLFRNNPAICARFMEKPVGVIAPGALGDVIALDYDPITSMTADNINSHVLFGMNGRNVIHTVIGGDIKMKNRELLNVDKRRALAVCRERAAKLARSING